MTVSLAHRKRVLEFQERAIVQPSNALNMESKMPDGVTAVKRSGLRAVAPDLVEPKKPKVLVFGKPGVGKTWASLDFPGVYYIDTEGGADLNHYRQKLKDAGGVYMGPEQGSLDFDILISEIQTLATERHEFRTVVIDSISELWNTALNEEQERLGEKDSSYGAYKRAPLRRFYTLLRWVNRLDMSVIFIAHAKDQWGKDEKGNREVIGETFDAPEKLEYKLHFVLNVLKMAGKRKARIGKSRLTGFPEGEVFDWSYASFADRYGKDVIEKAAKQIAIATPEQVAEISRLLEIVKVPEDWIEKTFKKAEVESWDEMDAEKIEANITLLKGKLS